MYNQIWLFRDNFQIQVYTLNNIKKKYDKYSFSSKLFSILDSITLF